VAIHRSQRRGAPTSRDGGADPGAMLRVSLRRPSIAILAFVLVAGLQSLVLSEAADAANTVPAAPSAVSAAPLDSAATVSWTVGANGGAPIVNFLLTAFVGSTVSSTQEVTATEVGSNLDPTPGALDSVRFSNGLVDGTTYSFTVASLNLVGTGSPSAQTNTVTPAGVPGLPSGAAAVAGNQSALVSWTVGANGGLPISHFVITPFVGSTAGTAVTIPAGATGSATDPAPGAADSFNVTGLTSGTTYFFTIAAENSDGTGTPSGQTNLVTPNSAPLAPSNVSASALPSSQISVHWTVGANDGDGITGFQVVAHQFGTTAQSTTNVAAGAVGSATDPTPGASDSSLISGLTPGTFYAFSVAARNAAGTGAASTLSGFVTPQAAILSASPASIDFGEVTVGDVDGPTTVTLTNAGSIPDTVTGITIGGADADDFVVQGGCGTVSPQQSCAVQVSFLPGTVGLRQATLTATGGPAAPLVVTLQGTGTEGYYQFNAQGRVDTFGDAASYGDASGARLNKPIVGMAATGDDGGYWLVASDGGIFNYGDADFFGSTGGIRLNQPIVGMAATPDDGGYWLVASDGGIFSYGDASFYGSTGGIHLNKPIVGMAPTPDGNGYWLVASDGGIFSYGDASFYGSTGGIHLNKPIVGIATTPDGGGYWLVATDGGIFSYGDASFFGSTGGIHLNQPIVGMASTPDGNGYWLVASDGGIFSYGDALFYGSDAGTGTSDIVGMVGDAPPTLQASLGVPALRQSNVQQTVLGRLGSSRMEGR
jgi:Fibronectin type III domain